MGGKNIPWQRLVLTDTNGNIWFQAVHALRIEACPGHLTAVSHPGLNTPNRSHLIIISSVVPWGFTTGQAPYRALLRAQNIPPLLHHHSEISSPFSPLTHIFLAGAFKRRKENEKQLFDGYWRAWGGSSRPGWEGLIGSVHVRRSEVANKCSLSESYGNKGMNHIALITIDEV